MEAYRKECENKSAAEKAQADNLRGWHVLKSMPAIIGPLKSMTHDIVPLKSMPHVAFHESMTTRPQDYQ